MCPSLRELFAAPYGLVYLLLSFTSLSREKRHVFLCYCSVFPKNLHKRNWSYRYKLDLIDVLLVMLFPCSVFLSLLRIFRFFHFCVSPFSIFLCKATKITHVIQLGINAAFYLFVIFLNIIKMRPSINFNSVLKITHSRLCFVTFKPFEINPENKLDFLQC